MEISSHFSIFAPFLGIFSLFRAVGHFLFCGLFSHFRISARFPFFTRRPDSQVTLRAQRLNKNQDRPTGLKFSSEIENFKRATHQTPIFFAGNSEGQDWTFSEQLPCRSAEWIFFSLCQRCREIWREILVKLSACYVFQGLGVRSGKFHQNFTPKTVWKAENFTQNSLCWGAALNISSEIEHFKRDWKLQARLIFCQSLGPLGMDASCWHLTFDFPALSAGNSLINLVRGRLLN